MEVKNPLPSALRPGERVLSRECGAPACSHALAPRSGGNNTAKRIGALERHEPDFLESWRLSTN
jgi:hypothetical protein